MKYELAMRMIGLAFLATALASSCVGAYAKQSVQSEAPLPAGFDLKPTQKSVVVVYAHSQGEMLSTLSRAALEASCQAAQSLSGETRMPRFAPGSEDALKFEIRRYTSADGKQSASYSEKEHVECAEADLKRDGPCACNYRKVSERSLYLERRQGDSTDRWQLTLTSRSGRHSRGPASALEVAAPSEALLLSMYGAAAGTRELAGQRCQLRRIERGGSRTETCLLLPGPDLPAKLHGRQLAQSVVQIQGPQAGQRLRWTETLLLLPRASVDSTVFELPAGVSFIQGPIINKEAQP